MGDNDTPAPITHSISPRIRVYAQPPGTWGRGSAVLISGEGESLLVDTLNDLPGTRRMLDAFADVLATAPIRTLVNTSGESDHCWGNQLIEGATIISSPGAAEEAREGNPSAMSKMGGLAQLMPGDMKVMVRRLTSGFDFQDITITPPTVLTDGCTTTLSVGGVDVHILDMGAARSRGDVAVWVPGDQTLISGDLVASSVHPLMGTSPDAWLSALDMLGALLPEVVVPGHGRIAGADALEATEGYVRLLEDSVRAALADSSKPRAVIRTVADAFASSRFSEWAAPERVASNVHSMWAWIDPDHSVPAPPSLVTQMGRLANRQTTPA